MKRFISFLLIGSFFAAAEEFLTIVVIRSKILQGKDGCTCTTDSRKQIIVTDGAGRNILDVDGSDYVTRQRDGRAIVEQLSTGRVIEADRKGNLTIRDPSGKQLNDDPAGSFIVTVFILFPVFLTFAWFTSKLLDAYCKHELAADLAYFLICPFIGLLFEWFVMGLAPWKVPLDPGMIVLMFLFQLGMFSFWAAVAFAPRVFLKPHAKRLRFWLLAYFLPYLAFMYVISLSAPASKKFAVIIPLVLVGYGLLNIFWLRYFIGMSRAPALELAQAPEPMAEPVA